MLEMDNKGDNATIHGAIYFPCWGRGARICLRKLNQRQFWINPRSTIRVDSRKWEELITILLCPAKPEFSLLLGKTNFHSISCWDFDVLFVGETTWPYLTLVLECYIGFSPEDFGQLGASLIHR